MIRFSARLIRLSLYTCTLRAFSSAFEDTFPDEAVVEEEVAVAELSFMV